jgi:hypothetical protein
MFTIAGFFFKLEIYEVYGDSPEEGLCHFWLQAKEQSRFFFGNPAIFGDILEATI